MVLFLSGGIWGCGIADVINDLKYDPNQLYVRVTTEPENCKVVLRSMNTSKITSYNSPVEINYILRPFMASYIEVSQEGYKTKTVRLESGREEMHVKLDKLTQEEIDRVKYYGTSTTMGPGSHGEIGGGIGDEEEGAINLGADGIPEDDINITRGRGMGGFSEFGL